MTLTSLKNLCKLSAVMCLSVNVIVGEYFATFIINSGFNLCPRFVEEANQQFHVEKSE